MLNSIKSKLAKSIKNKKLNVFGVFFLIAFLILVVTKLSETYVETVPFTISYKNLPQNHIIILDSMPKVNVTLSTYGFNLFSYYFYNKSYELDFEKSTYQNTDNYVWLAEKGLYDLKEQLSKSVTIVNVKPDTLFLPYGTLSVKRVPIILTSKINFAPGYDSIDEIEIIPDSVDVIGAENAISKVDVIETEDFELNDIKKNIETSVDLKLVDVSGSLKLSEEKIKIKAIVEKFTEGTFEVPITILNIPKNVEINYFPKYIKVAYYTSLKNYKQIKINDFKVECNYRDVLNTNNTYLEPKLIVSSKKVKAAKMKQNKVEYIIVK